MPFLHLDQHIECRGRSPFQNGLLRAAPACLLVGQGNALYPANQVRERRIQQQVLQCIAVRRTDKLYATFVDRARCLGFTFAADFVDDDHFRIVILHCLDHRFVLMCRSWNLHSASPTHGRVGNVSIPADLIARIHNDHALLLGQDASDFTQHSRLANARPSKDQDAVTLGDDVLDDGDCSIYSATDAAGQTNHLFSAVADARNSMQRSRDAGPVVVVERTDARHHLCDFLVRYFGFAQNAFAVHIAGSGSAAEIHDDFKEPVLVPFGFNAFPNAFGQYGQ